MDTPRAPAAVAFQSAWRSVALLTAAAGMLALLWRYTPLASLVSPQRLSYYLLNSVPVSLIFCALAVLGWAVSEDKDGTRVSGRQLLLLLLLGWAGFTTLHADFPAEALTKWGWVWKALAFAIFLPFTLRTRLRIEALSLFMTLSAASIIIVGGIKTLASGVLTHREKDWSAAPRIRSRRACRELGHRNALSRPVLAQQQKDPALRIHHPRFQASLKIATRGGLEYFGRRGRDLAGYRYRPSADAREGAAHRRRVYVELRLSPVDDPQLEFLKRHQL